MMPVSRLLKSWAIAAGELADGLRPLGPHQALLQLAAVGDVGAASDQPPEPALRASKRGTRHVQQPAVLPVVPPHAVLEPQRLALRHAWRNCSR